jgi:hypothetical protein
LQLPAVIVAISVGIRWDDYGTDQYCWLSTNNGTIWAFIAPLLLIVTFNAVVFVRVMISIFALGSKVRGSKSTSDENDRLASLKKGLRASLSFLCLLGVTWIFGALAIGSAAVAFFYLFALCNVVQGVFIFVFHLYLDQRLV